MVGSPDTGSPSPVLPTLVLLPGLDGTGIGFERLVAALPGVPVSVIRYASDAAGYDSLLDFVRAALPQDARYVLLGESYSGPIAARLASENLPRLAGLVLCASFLSSPRPRLAPLGRLLRFAPAQRVPTGFLLPVLLNGCADPAARELMRRMGEGIPPRTLYRRLADVAAVDETPAARQVTVPTLYLKSRADRLVPAAAADAVKQYIPQTEIELIDSPHMLLQAAPDAAAEILHCFLSRCAV
jgi:pimeloyl-ACP methyl ester carboxylesterase